MPKGKDRYVFHKLISRNALTSQHKCVIHQRLIGIGRHPVGVIPATARSDLTQFDFLQDDGLDKLKVKIFQNSSVKRIPTGCTVTHQMCAWLKLTLKMAPFDRWVPFNLADVRHVFSPRMLWKWRKTLLSALWVDFQSGSLRHWSLLLWGAADYSRLIYICSTLSDRECEYIRTPGILSLDKCIKWRW